MNNKDENCVFCKIIAGEIPAPKIYEDEYFYAFLDAAPIREGHTLVIPKNHHAYLEDMPADEYSKMMLVVQKLKRHYKNIFKVQHVGLVASGWDVPHTHVHIIPMHDSKDITSKPQLDGTAPQFSTKEFGATAAKITQVL